MMTIRQAYLGVTLGPTFAKYYVILLIIASTA